MITQKCSDGKVQRKPVKLEPSPQVVEFESTSGCLRHTPGVSGFQGSELPYAFKASVNTDIGSISVSQLH